MRTTDYAVVVPARDAAATLGACLEALADQADPVPEVIVVDDGSSDATGAIAEAWARDVDPARVGRARVIRQAPRGAAAARNAGFRAARAPIVLFTDADCRPLPDWSRHLVAALLDPGVAAAMGQLASDQRELVARLVQAEYADKQAATDARGELAFADTATAAFRTDVLHAIGGFDEGMAAVEDTELAFRLAAAGHRMAFVRAAVVRHQHPATWAAYARRKLRFGRWGAHAYLAHPRRIAGDGRTPGAMRLQLGLGALVLASAPVAAALSLVAIAADRPASPPGREAAALASLPLASTVLASTALLALIALVLASIPQAVRTARRGHGADVALATPLLVLLRTFALLVGLGIGAAERWAGRRRLPRPAPNALVAPLTGRYDDVR